MLSPFSILHRGLSHICIYTGCPKKVTNSMLLEPLCSSSITSQWSASLWPGKCFFLSLIRLSRIKRSQAMSIVQFSPTALKFGYDFVLTVNFFRTPCMLPRIPSPFRTIFTVARICHLPSDEHTSVG